MKLVLSDYIASLKEDLELDTFTVNLLKELDIIPLTVPQRGRQHGVDIAAVGPDFDNPIQSETLFLIAVKRGDISRATWNTGVNAVRSTLDEIKDVYINACIPDKYKNFSKKIVLVSNGSINQNVNIDWVGYTRTNSTDRITYDFWGIDKLILLAEKSQFTESLFPKDVQSLLRKSLALLDLVEYDYRHFYALLNKLLVADDSLSKKSTIKKLRLINSCLSIVFYWAEGYNNVKPALVIGERVLLNTWNWLRKNSFSQDPDIIIEYLAILKTKSQIDFNLFLKVKDVYLIEDGLAFTGHMEHTEYCLLTYEQIGIISTIGLTKLWYAEIGMYQQDELFQNSLYQFQDAEVIADFLCHLINNNPSSLYPKFDEHSIDINLAMILLYETGRFETAAKWLGGLINYLSLNYSLYGFFPLWITDYKKLAELAGTREQCPPESSILITVLAEWCLILRQYDMYYNLRYISNDLVKGVNLQLWKPDKETEETFYIKNTMHDSGESKVSIVLHKNVREYLMEMTEERSLWTDESEMSFFKQGVPFIGYLAFRHFRTYVFPIFWRQFLNSPFCFNRPEKTSV